MRLPELGHAIRQARIGRGLTQKKLAADAGVSRNTLNRLESGVFPDLGIRKASGLLGRLGLTLEVRPMALKQTQPDFVSMAATSAGVSFKTQLTPDELIEALLTGKATPGKQAHFIVLLEEAPAVLLSGLLKQVGGWVKPGKVQKNLHKIAKQVGVPEGAGHWLKIA